MKLAGTLWRVKPNRQSLMYVMMRPTVLGKNFYSVSEDEISHCLRGDEIILVISNDLSRSVENFQHTFVEVVTPRHGYMNSTYFTSDSLWLDRIG